MRHREWTGAARRKAMEGIDLVGTTVAGGGEHDGSGDKVVGLPAGTPMIQLIKSADEERGARKQDHRESKLTDDEHVAKPLMTATPSHAARAAL